VLPESLGKIRFTGAKKLKIKNKNKFLFLKADKHQTTKILFQGILGVNRGERMVIPIHGWIDFHAQDALKYDDFLNYRGPNTKE
jgi:hypothetical protein